MKGLHLLAIYDDAASARRDDNLMRRDGLADAIAAANRDGADLVVVRLDRLSRNTADVGPLLASFKGCVHSIEEDLRLSSARRSSPLMQAVAEAQAVADRISLDTTQALSEAKAEGKTLGMPVDKRVAAQASVKVRRQNAAVAVERIADLLDESVAYSAMTAGELVKVLNDRRIPTGAGRKWTVPALRRPLRDAKALQQERAELLALPAGYLFDGNETSAGAVTGDRSAHGKRADHAGEQTNTSGDGHAEPSRARSRDGKLSSLMRHPDSGSF